MSETKEKTDVKDADGMDLYLCLQGGENNWDESSSRIYEAKDETVVRGYAMERLFKGNSKIMIVSLNELRSLARKGKGRTGADGCHEARETGNEDLADARWAQLWIDRMEASSVGNGVEVIHGTQEEHDDWFVAEVDRRELERGEIKTEMGNFKNRRVWKDVFPYPEDCVRILMMISGKEKGRKGFENSKMLFMVSESQEAAHSAALEKCLSDQCLSKEDHSEGEWEVGIEMNLPAMRDLMEKAQKETGGARWWSFMGGKARGEKSLLKAIEGGATEVLDTEWMAGVITKMEGMVSERKSDCDFVFESKEEELGFLESSLKELANEREEVLVEELKSRLGKVGGRV